MGRKLQRRSKCPFNLSQDFPGTLIAQCPHGYSGILGVTSDGLWTYSWQE